MGTIAIKLQLISCFKIRVVFDRKHNVRHAFFNKLYLLKINKFYGKNIHNYFSLYFIFQNYITMSDFRISQTDFQCCFVWHPRLFDKKGLKTLTFCDEKVNILKNSVYFHLNLSYVSLGSILRQRKTHLHNSKPKLAKYTTFL